MTEKKAAPPKKPTAKVVRASGVVSSWFAANAGSVDHTAAQARLIAEADAAMERDYPGAKVISAHFKAGQLRIEAIKRSGASASLRYGQREQVASAKPAGTALPA